MDSVQRQAWEEEISATSFRTESEGATYPHQIDTGDRHRVDRNLDLVHTFT